MVLDVACGSRMFWFDRTDKRAVFVDKRAESHVLTDVSSRGGSRMLVIDANRDAERVIRLLEERQSPLKPVAVLDSQGTSAKEIAGVPVRGKLNKLEDVIREEGISHLLQCADLEHTINLLSLCRQHGITYMLLPSVLGIVGVQERIDEIEGQPVTAVHY
jgi:FlaA1/EpsC-like NDP-sugar epimerase